MKSKNKSNPFPNAIETKRPYTVFIDCSKDEYGFEMVEFIGDDILTTPLRPRFLLGSI